MKEANTKKNNKKLEQQQEEKENMTEIYEVNNNNILWCYISSRILAFMSSLLF